MRLTPNLDVGEVSSERKHAKGLVSGNGYVLEVICSPKQYNGTLLQYSCLENPMDGRAW